MSKLKFITKTGKNKHTTNAIFNNINIFNIEYEEPALNGNPYYWIYQSALPNFVTDVDGNIIRINTFYGEKFETLDEAKKMAQDIFDHFLEIFKIKS